MTRIVAYIRQSSEEAVKRDLSCPAQEERFWQDLERRRSQTGETIDGAVAPWDEGKSGGDMDRSGLKWLLERLDTTDEIWTWDTDRLVRHSFFAPYIMNELRTRGIMLWGPWGRDERTPMGRFTTDMRMRFGAYYREEIGETAKRTRDFRLKQGLWSGHAPTGYKFVFEAGDHSRRILVPDPETAPTVQAVFRRIAEGFSQKEACRLMGVKQSTYIWQRDNPLYIGLVFKHRDNIDAMAVRTYETFWNLAQDKQVEWIFPGRHEAIIDEATWDAVERLRANGPRGPRSERRPLSGCIRCETCGRSMFLHNNHGWPEFRCDRCSWRKSYRQVELVVLGALVELTESQKFERDVEAELARPADVDRSVLDNLLLERSKVIRQLEKAMDLLIEENDLEDGLRQRAVALKRRKDTVDREIAKEQARIAAVPSLVRAWRDARQLIELTPAREAWSRATVKERHDLVKGAFKRIIASPSQCTLYPAGLSIVMECDWPQEEQERGQDGRYGGFKEATTGIELLTVPERRYRLCSMGTPTGGE